MTLNTAERAAICFLGLLDDHPEGSGFTDLKFSVTVGGATVLSEDFTSVAAADAFFSNDVIDLGAAAQSASLQVVINFALTTSSASSGYGEDFLLGLAADRPARRRTTTSSNAGKSDFLIENSSGAVQVGQIGSNGQVAYSPLGLARQRHGCSSGRATTSTRGTTSS